MWLRDRSTVHPQMGAEPPRRQSGREGTGPSFWAPVLVAVASALSLGLGTTGCSHDEEAPATPRLPEPISEHADIRWPETSIGTSGIGTIRERWAEADHVSISALAAEKWRLTPARVRTIGDAADDPDTYEAGLAAGYSQQWSHAYLYSALGFWVWGDANENFDDCITGELGNQWEESECKDGGSAAHYYAAGDQRTGDTYLGYATHYIEDVSQVLHASDPTLEPGMLTHHERFERWIADNWTAGHCFQAALASDYFYYALTDLQQAVRNAAWAASYWNPAGPGRTAWNAYRDSGYPAGPGTGNVALVRSTQEMLIRASRYATGTIKYALDTYAEWDAEY